MKNIFKACIIPGLEDSTGQKIHEGDIIEFPPPWIGAKPYRFTIIFRQTLRHGIGFYEDRGENMFADPDGEYYKRYGKVVGNIYP